jgi:hypothetical protein
MLGIRSNASQKGKFRITINKTGMYHALPP